MRNIRQLALGSYQLQQNVLFVQRFSNEIKNDVTVEGTYQKMKERLSNFDYRNELLMKVLRKDSVQSKKE